MKKTLTLLALLTCFVSTECLAGMVVQHNLTAMNTNRQLATTRNCIKYTPEQAAAVASDQGNTFSVTYSGSKVRRGGNTNADCDMVNNNILQQAAQSMLAQANQSNQGVLSLLQ